MISDGELLANVLGRKNFLESAFHDDVLDDWSLARDLGAFLVRIEPDSEILGHALQARACRHLGELERAREELAQCQTRIAQRGLRPWEAELIRPLLIEEEKVLRRLNPRVGGPDRGDG
jgi:hypothetical protein